MMREIGQIVRLQIQTDRLKRGERPYQIYSTDNIHVVPALKLTAKGVVGAVGETAVIYPGDKLFLVD